MAIVQGIREKVHLPIYDSVLVDPERQLRDVERSSTLKFFINVQGKTKLETNLQSASLLPHYNTFEARAMRVVISDLPPRFSDDKEVTLAGVTGEGENEEDIEVTTSVNRAMELLDEARADEDGEVDIQAKEGKEVDEGTDNAVTVTFTVVDLEEALDESENGPAPEQIDPGNGSGNVIAKFIFNTVTTFYVGEKVMIEMPTWNFPGGAGAWSLGAACLSHGEPSPLATFRFAEPIYIDRQQNFRVEIEIPDADTLKEIQKIYGPLYIWVVLDGYMTRGVQ